MNATFEEKLRKIAEILAKQKPHLRFFGLVHRSNFPNRWDLIVCSDKLEPHSLGATKYIVGLLGKKLTGVEMARIARVVVLGVDNKLVAALIENPHIQPAELRLLHPSEQFDVPPIVLWPEHETVAAGSGTRRRQ